MDLVQRKESPTCWLICERRATAVLRGGSTRL